MASKVDESGLSFDSLARLGARLNLRILAGATKSAVDELPVNTLFGIVTDQHWLLCLKGEHRLLVFDSLGLPIGALSHMLKGIAFTPWNRFGYQDMWSSVCGYYIIAITMSIRHGELIHTGDVDKLVGHICPYRVSRPKSMPEWYRIHRNFSNSLKKNDDAVVKYVSKTFPGLAQIDRHAPALNGLEPHTGLIGSPIYAHAGIHAPSVHQAMLAERRQHGIERREPERRARSRSPQPRRRSPSPPQRRAASPARRGPGPPPPPPPPGPPPPPPGPAPAPAPTGNAVADEINKRSREIQEGKLKLDPAVQLKRRATAKIRGQYKKAGEPGEWKAYLEDHLEEMLAALREQETQEEARKRERELRTQAALARAEEVEASQRAWREQLEQAARQEFAASGTSEPWENYWARYLSLALQKQ